MKSLKYKWLGPMNHFDKIIHCIRDISERDIKVQLYCIDSILNLIDINKGIIDFFLGNMVWYC